MARVTKYADMWGEYPRLKRFPIDDDKFAMKIEFKYNILTMNHVTQDIIDSYDFSQHQDLTVISIFGDYIQRLNVPDGIEYMYCSKCGLRELSLPDSLKLLVCDDNYIEHLDLPASIEVVEANNNFIREISFRGPPENLSVLELKSNRLLSLDFTVSDCMSKIDIDDNPHLSPEKVSLPVWKFIRTQVLAPRSLQGFN